MAVDKTTSKAISDVRKAGKEIDDSLRRYAAQLRYWKQFQDDERYDEMVGEQTAIILAAENQLRKLAEKRASADVAIDCIQDAIALLGQRKKSIANRKLIERARRLRAEVARLEAKIGGDA